MEKKKSFKEICWTSKQKQNNISYMPIKLRQLSKNIVKMLNHVSKKFKFKYYNIVSTGSLFKYIKHINHWTKKEKKIITKKSQIVQTHILKHNNNNWDEDRNNNHKENLFLPPSLIPRLNENFPNY